MKLKFKFTYLKFFLALSLVLSLGTGIWFYRAAFHGLKALDRDRDEAGEQNPKLWQAWFSRGRQSPDQRPSAFHRLQALKQKFLLPLARPVLSTPQARFKPLSAPPSSPPPGPGCDWTELGPAPENDSFYGNVSGRVTSLATDLTNDPTGNTLYVGTAYGGLWKTTNGLAAVPSFIPISDQTQSLAMGSFALDTSVNPPVIYVGTGELNMAGDSYYGVGILKSPDGGANWTLVSSANGGAIPFLGVAFSKILVDPTSPSTILAATGLACCSGITTTDPSKGLYRSTDQGASWTQTSIAGHSTTDIIYDGANAIFYAAVRFQGIYKSVDHGATWTLLPTNGSPFPSLTPPDTNNFARATLANRGVTLWCLVANGNEAPSAPGAGDTGLSQSIDGGNTWTNVNLPVVSGGNLFDFGFGGQGTYDQYVAAPPGASSLLVAGIDLFSTTTVNGTSTTWTNLTNAYNTGKSHPDQHAAAFVNANTWYIGNDGGVWSTANAGGAFKDINNDLGTIQFYGVSADPSTVSGFLGGTQDNGSPYTNAPPVWTEVAGGDGGFTDVNPAVLGQFYGENFGIGLFRVDNFGSGFVTVVNNPTIPNTENAAILVPYKVIPGLVPQVIYGTSRIWKGPGNASNGAGWVTISNYLTGSNSGDVLWLDVSASNPNYIYATTDDGGGPSVYQVYSNGGGAVWNNVSTGLPSGNPMAAIAVDPLTPTTAYVGVQGFVGSAGSGHVFQTINGGGGWTDITGNLPDAPVNSILVDPQFPGDVYVANDVGIFATQNVNGGSTSWARLGTLLPDSTVLQIKMSVTCPRVILAGTHGRGAWSICPLDVYCPPTATPTATNTPTNTPTVTSTPTNTPSGTPSPTNSPTPASYTAATPVLFPNPYPNPKNPGAPPQLQVSLSSSSDIQVRIFTTASRKIRDEFFPGVPAGTHNLPLDLKDKAGAPLANTLYYVAVDTKKDHYILKLLILK